MECPISLEPIVEPVTTLCGHTFERSQLKDWLLSRGKKCPNCRAPVERLPDVNVGMKAMLAMKATQQPRVLRVAAIAYDDVHLIPGGFGAGLLGRGATGEVRLGTLQGCDDRVAVKIVKPESTAAISALQRELELLQRLGHPHVVALLGAVQNRVDSEMWAILEYAEHGSLHRLLHEETRGVAEKVLGGSLNLKDAMSMANSPVFRIPREICAALVYLHKNRVVHGDMKTANVLIAGKGRCKLADFGLSRVLNTQVSTVNASVRGTPAYMAPELLQHGQPPSFQSDVYGLGVIMAELCSGRPPFDGVHMFAIMMQVCQGQRPTLVEVAGLTELIRGCWEGQPGDRPSARTLLEELIDLVSIGSASSAAHETGPESPAGPESPETQSADMEGVVQPEAAGVAEQSPGMNHATATEEIIPAEPDPQPPAAKRPRRASSKLSVHDWVYVPGEHEGKVMRFYGQIRSINACGSYEVKFQDGQIQNIHRVFKAEEPPPPLASQDDSMSTDGVEVDSDAAEPTDNAGGEDEMGGEEAGTMVASSTMATHIVSEAEQKESDANAIADLNAAASVRREGNVFIKLEQADRAAKADTINKSEQTKQREQERAKYLIDPGPSSMARTTACSICLLPHHM